MRIGELAAALGISKDTVESWLKRDELIKYFSNAALLKTGAAQRQFTEADVLALNTVRRLRYEESTTDWQKIADYLETGERAQEFPQAAITADPRTIPLQQAEQSARAAATLAERDAALARVQWLERELEASREKNDQLFREMMKEMGELQYKIGRLEAENDALKKNKE